MQLLVSVGGIMIMVGLAWLLDRAGKVPTLFVDTAGLEASRAAIESENGVTAGPRAGEVPVVAGAPV
jgi:hypothetical protein